ncbi:MAG: DNA invertase Pin-like site-specific DNA recombinase [Bacteroidia bacterium]|jgi:DNA invertase Pin-like site-specific DNA recombinase|tara:strand:- start:587 stop:1183 length:597 start_codon:yes stop_codon:yes gene_type:complete
MKSRYIRVSTASQNQERQLYKEHPNEELFIDVISGAIPFSERPKGKELLTLIEGNKVEYLSVSSICRLGRNLFDVLLTLEKLNESQTTLKVDNLGIESLIKGKPNAAFKLIISVLANIAEMERDTLLQRQKEGIAIAKAKGIYKGRVKGSKESESEFLDKYKDVAKYLKQGQSLRNTAKLCDVSLGTVQKVKQMLLIL